MSEAEEGAPAVEAVSEPAAPADNAPLSAEEARENILRTYFGTSTGSNAPVETVPMADAVPYVPPLPREPAPGTANVRIKNPFPVHFFVIPQFDLTIAQDSWINVPQEQLAEIVQIAAQNQVLLETEEASA